MAEMAQVFVVGRDLMSEGTLAVVPAALAVADTARIRALVDSQTVGELREAGLPDVLAEVAEVHDDRVADDPDLGLPEFGELPDSHPFNVVDWLGMDGWYYHVAVLRVQTGRHAPKEILEEFGQADHAFGMDYERATWFKPEDREAIVQRLRDLGYTVVQDQALLDRYDYSQAGTGRRHEPRQWVAPTQSGFPIPRVRVRVRGADGREHEFTSAGLHEDVTFAVNDTTGELVVERVAYGPRGDDEWARLGSEVVAAWAVADWESVTVVNAALAPVLGERVVVQVPRNYGDMTREQKIEMWLGVMDRMRSPR